MTVRGGISSSRCLLAGSRDTANESRYDGSRRYDVGLLSSQCVTLGSNFLCKITIFIYLQIDTI
ncbi:hypothetical protein [Wolbachia endosymbiont (group A) of Agelastica alni]|uniref:hypothetical protein n=1 Tax=Wolbachia endosymbiont (group A) of Agelastica alni TaxID=3066130 RepID=UPI00333E692C